MRIYLDTNVYNALLDAGEEGDAVRWLAESGHCVTASMLNLIELARTVGGNPDRARALVATLTCVATDYEDPPFADLHAQEFLREAQRLRPQWLRPGNLEPRTRLLVQAREQWAAVKRSPENAFAKLGVFDQLHRQLEQSHRATQQLVGSTGAPEQGPDFGADYETFLGNEFVAELRRLPAVEQWTRKRAFEEWGLALFNFASRNDLREWLSGQVEPTMTHTELARFWLSDVDLNNTPHYLVRGAALMHQPEEPLRLSNRNDLDQVNWLLRSDAFATGDGPLATILNSIRTTVVTCVPTIRVARVIHLPQGRALQALRNAVPW